MFKDFIHLLFPVNCYSCGKVLNKKEKSICIACYYRLPKTNYHRYSDNPIMKMFWGRTPIHSATAYYRFSKSSNVQRLIHQLKYRNKTEIGDRIGYFLGNDLKETELFNTADLVIPVPLHPSKLKSRGYNQSDFLARGIAASMGIKVDVHNLYRRVNNETQTHKSKYERWENVAAVFELKNPAIFTNKHILLVDDVITTGATLEACAIKLVQAGGAKISIATMAYAQL
jgi:ComF family protein